MNFHTRINDATTAFITGPQRTANLRAMLETEREVVRSSPRDSYNERVAADNVADLEGLIVRSEENDRIREQGEAERSASAIAKRAERQDADEAALKAQLRTQFLGQPGATADDFERLYPRLRDEHMVRQSHEALASAKSRIRI